MIRTTRFVTLGLTILIAAALAAAPALADKKIKAYKAQSTHSFVNSESEAVFGLKVTLSAAGEVKTEGETGQAGPFRDIQGNGTASIKLKNPTAPIEPGDPSFDLVFGTYAKKIEVTSWWWIDAKGKRVGKKKKA